MDCYPGGSGNIPSKLEFIPTWDEVLNTKINVDPFFLICLCQNRLYKVETSFFKSKMWNQESRFYGAFKLIS